MASDSSERADWFQRNRVEGGEVRNEWLRFAGLVALLVTVLAVAAARERGSAAVSGHRFKATAFLRFDPQSPARKGEAAPEERAAQMRYLALIALHSSVFFESEVKAHGLERRLGGYPRHGLKYPASYSARRLRDAVDARLSGPKGLSLSVALDDPLLSRQVLGWLVSDLKTRLAAEARDIPDDVGQSIAALAAGPSYARECTACAAAGEASSRADRHDSATGALFHVARYSTERIERTTASLNVLLVAMGLLSATIISGLSIRRLRSPTPRRQTPPLSLVVP